MRPHVPEKWSSTCKNIVTACWDADPKLRPEFSQIVSVLEGRAKKKTQAEKKDKETPEVLEVDESKSRTSIQ